MECEDSFSHSIFCSYPKNLHFFENLITIFGKGEMVEKYILPLSDAAEAAYGKKLDIMLSPWSPPVYMKTNGERDHGGK